MGDCIFIFLASFIFAQNISAPSAQQLCLEDSTKLFQLLSANPCEWKTRQEGQPWPYECKAVLQCTVPDSANAQYSVCPNIPGISESPWSAELAKTVFDTDKKYCSDRDTHLKRCQYSPDRVDGTLYGDDPTISEAYCRIRTKPQTPAQR